MSTFDTDRYFPDFPPFRNHNDDNLMVKDFNLKYNVDSFVWVKLKPLELGSQKLLGRFTSGSGTETGKDGNDPYEIKSIKSPMYFLMPKSWGTQIVHTWAPYAGNIADIINGFIKDAKTFGVVSSSLEGLGSALFNTLTGKIPKAKGIVNEFVKAFGADSKWWHNKFDTSLIYTDSNRRVFQFQFILMDYGYNALQDNNRYTNPIQALGASVKRQVVDPIKQLKKLSCPRSTGALSYKPPHIFEISAVCNGEELKDFLYVRRAALTDVQPTYYEPYIGGYPTYCEVLLTFQDMEPLFESTYTTNTEAKTVINVSEF